MSDRTYKILLVEPDSAILEILVASLSRRFDAQITCVGDATACLDTDTLEPHDLVIAEMNLPDGSGIDLAEQLLALSSRPVILLESKRSIRRAVAALRLGVADLLHKPFPVEELLCSARQAMEGHDRRRRLAIRHRRMRELVRRMIRERRALNRRVDLVCRDLVGAQQRLVQRVLARESAQSRG